MFFSYKQRLYQPIDIAPLVVFRILFGMLLFAEAFGAMLTGWVQQVFIEPQFTFSHIGFEWLQPLPGVGMYFYFSLLAVLGLFIAAGFYYRISMLLYAVLWLGVYLMQKTSYNNHYYLLVLLNFIMVFMPAERYFSFDARRKPEITSEVVPYWTSVVFVLQIGVVYTFAAIAKLYPDWLQGITTAHFFDYRSSVLPDWLIVDMPVLSGMLSGFSFIYDIPGINYFVAYTAILFDLLIVPGLVWKKTRRFTFILALVFHLFNSFTFGIGIFPYLALALCIFCFDPEKVRRLFMPRKVPVIKSEIYILLTRRHSWGMFAFACYFLWQVLLPLRHHLFDGEVLWNEAGHRLSWRMMLRSKSGKLTIVANLDGKEEYVKLNNYLTRKQQAKLKVQPDFMWQFAQRLKNEYKKQGYKEISLNYDSFVRVNGKPSQRFVDKDVDLSKEEWNTFNSQRWILPYKD